MPTRAERQASDARKAERAEALKLIGGGDIPLPTEPHTTPAIYSDDIGPECLDLGKCGLSEVEMAAHLAIDIETLRDWAEGHPSLAADLSRARTASEAWWEEKIRRAVLTGDNRFPAASFVARMKAHSSRYRDRVEIDHRIDLRSLVMIDARSPGLLGEQGVIDAEPLPEKEGGADRLTFAPSDSPRSDDE